MFYALVKQTTAHAFSSEKPYNSLPLLPPKAAIETAAVLKKRLLPAGHYLNLKGALTRLPNPTLFIDTIHLQEAQASSAIENIITTQDELFKASITGENIEDLSTKEVIHYKDALWYGIKQLEKKPLLTTNLFYSHCTDNKREWIGH